MSIEASGSAGVMEAAASWSPAKIQIIPGPGDELSMDSVSGVAEKMPEMIPYLDLIPLDRSGLAGSENAAQHELQHALVAIALGVPVLEINSVGNRSKGIGGWTILGETSTGDIMHTILSAGEMGTGGGGGDRAHSAMIDLQNGIVPGASFELYQFRARNIISQLIDPQTLSIASNILAYLGSASNLGPILERARFEADAMKKGINLADKFQDYPWMKEVQKQRVQRLSERMPEPPDNGSVISDYGPFRVNVKTYKDKKLIGEMDYCPCCGGKDQGHYVNCAIRKMPEYRDVLSEALAENEPQESRDMFPRSGSAEIDGSYGLLKPTFTFSKS